MKRYHDERVQDRILSRLERQEQRQAFQRDRFVRFKLREIHNRLFQTLLMKKIIETENPTAVSDELLKGLKKAMRSSEFDFKYFIAPIRELVARPNPHALYVTQYIMEVLIKHPDVIEIYGTDQEIYREVSEVFTLVNRKFERAEEEILKQLSHNKSLVPGSREYDIALDELIRKHLGEPQP
jgi:hypothetical protein